MSNGDEWDNIANNGDVFNTSKHSTSKNPSTSLYYRLHILSVGISDVQMYRCSGLVNGVTQLFYFKFDLLGRFVYIGHL